MGKGKNIIIVVLVLIILVLGGFIVYDKVLKEDKKEEGKTKETNTLKDDILEAKYELISDEEINDIMESKVVDFLNKQDNDVTDVKKFLQQEKYNDEIIVNSFIEKDAKEESTEYFTKGEIKKYSKELFGYDIELNYRDILDSCDDSEVGLKWDSINEKYVHYDGAFQCGRCVLDDCSAFEYNNLNISKDDNNIYTVIATQIWTDYAAELDYSGKYYANYNDAKNESNSILTLSDDQIYEVYGDGGNKSLLFSDSSKLNKYEYKIVKEDGIIRVLSYKKI